MLSLQTRILRTMFGMFAIGMVVYLGAVSLTTERMERFYLDQQVGEDVTYLAARMRENTVEPLPQLARVRAWLESPGRDDQPPAAFARLPLGSTHAVRWEGSSFHVQRVAIDDGTLTVAMNIDASEDRERTLYAALYGGGALLVVLLVGLIHLTSRRIARPIRQLADELRASGTAAITPAFAPRYRDVEVETIARALDGYIAEQQRQLEHERRFAAAASHELRTPLTVIRSSLELIMTTARDLPLAVEKPLLRAQRAADSLAPILDGLLALSRPTDLAQRQHIRLDSLVKDWIAERPDGEKSRFRLNLAPTNVLVQPAHVHAVVQNLLRNALRHAPHGPIDVTLAGGNFTVRDVGPGFSAALLDEGFAAGRIGPSSQGFGLGLYIVSEVLRGYGLTWSARNAEPSGAVVRVDWGPALSSPESAPPSADRR
ncbi:MAG: HAMP domain-containing sensor histidine kinase [Oceanococcaceae bacterium]